MKYIKNKKISNGIKIILLLLVLFPVMHAVAADGDYTVLAPLPGIGDGKNQTTTLEKYLPAVFDLAIGISAIFAVLMIVLGGFQYMSSDAIQGKSEGLARLKNSVFGLVLVIGAWLILNEVNPKLLDVNLKIDPATTTQVDGGEIAPAATTGDLKCPTGECDLIPNNIKISASGKTLNKAILPKVQALDASLKKDGLELIITEAYPPSRHHQAACHTTGTCIDARKVPDNKVKSFTEAAWNAGMRADFEVETNTRKDAILSASCGNDSNCRSYLAPSIKVLPPKADGTRQITGEHFSVYNR